ncbi:MAG: transposase [Ignavibacteria bacterium]|nr:transposase [Ignavibacteria bacterium]
MECDLSASGARLHRTVHSFAALVSYVGLDPVVEQSGDGVKRAGSANAGNARVPPFSISAPWRRNGTTRSSQRWHSA